MFSFNNTIHFFAITFFAMGIFALIGGIYTWGEGYVFWQKETSKVLLPLSDLFLAGPMALITALGIYQRKVWGFFLGILLVGIFIHGSVLVFISEIHGGLPISLKNVIPASLGFIFSVAFAGWAFKNRGLLLFKK